jgi:hypothetical protein
MDWIVTGIAGLGLMIILLPLFMLVVTVFVLVPLAHFYRPGASLSRTSFACPFSHRHVSTTFVTEPGADRPSDVTECSVFTGGEIRCEKGCLELAHAAAEPSAMVPRFALLAGSETYADGKRPAEPGHAVD